MTFHNSMATRNDDMAGSAKGPSQRAEDDPSTGTTNSGKTVEVNRTEGLGAGDIAGDYIISQKIGWGGCSTVYAAEHKTLGHRVAVKVMHAGLAESQRQVQRFIQEAEAIKKLRHPTIVEVYGYGRLGDGRPYIVMELLDGVNLASLIQACGRFSPRETLEMLEPISEALAMAHAAGIIHRDIKASNIVIVEHDDRRQVKLLDFGIAKLLYAGSGSMQTTVGHVLGTPHSMAPEQIRGLKLDGRTDLYALGALLYRLLTGKHPFEGADAVTLTRMHVHTQPPPPSQSAPVSPALDAVVRRAMEKDPAYRYDTALAFIEALREAVGHATPAVEDRAKAVGIYVECRVDASIDADVDDVLLDDLMNILDIAEQVFHENGFSMPLQTGNAILGARLMPDGETEDVRRQAMDVAAALEQELCERPDADERIDVNVCLHVADADVRTSGEVQEIVGGSIVNIGSWAPDRTIEGVCATPETLGFALEARDPSSRSYVRIGAARGSRV